MTGKEYLQKNFPQIHLWELAEKIDCNPYTLRGWVERNRIPVEGGEKIAKALGVVEEEIWKYFEKAGPRRTKKPQIKGNIFPILRAIVNSDVRSISAEELDHILRIPNIDKLRPGMVDSLLHYRPKEDSIQKMLLSPE